MDAEKVLKFPGGCPDAEQLAAYVDGTQAAQQHGAVEAHLAHCERCTATLGEAVRFQAEEFADSGSEWGGGKLKRERLLPLRRTVVATGSMLGMAAALLLMTREQIPDRGPDERLQAILSSRLAAERSMDPKPSTGSSLEAFRIQATDAAGRTNSRQRVAFEAVDLAQRRPKGHAKGTFRRSDGPGGSLDSGTADREVVAMLGSDLLAALERCQAQQKKASLLRLIGAYARTWTGAAQTESESDAGVAAESVAGCLKSFDGLHAVRPTEQVGLRTVEKRVTEVAIRPLKP